jgi:hypothetical protein
MCHYHSFERMGHRNVLSRFTQCVCLLHISLLGPLAVAPCAYGDAFNDLVAAWNDRERAVQAGTIEWRQVDLIPAHTEMTQAAPTKTGPSQDMFVELECKFTFRETKRRYEYQGPQWIDDKAVFRPRNYVSVTDGVISKWYFAGDQASEPQFFPMGFVKKDGLHSESNSVLTMPLLLLYRPSDLAIGDGLFEISTSRLGSPASLHGVRCLVLEHSKDGGRQTARTWIDPARAYLPLRVSKFTDGNPVFQIDLSYIVEPMAGYVPTGWTITVFRSVSDAAQVGRVFREYTATVTKCLLNEAIDVNTFTFDFPVGTIVRDYRTDNEYIVRPGGRKRPITLDERRAELTYEQLLATEPSLPSLRGRRSGAIVWTVLGLLVVACIGLRCLRYRRAIVT